MTSSKMKRLARRQDDLQSEIHGIFGMARTHKYTYKQTLEWISDRIYNSKYYKTLPRYSHHYLDGFMRANWNRIEREEIEQMIIWQGNLISTKDPQLSGHWHEINDFPDEAKPHMYWKGTDKRYY
jgi:hypothetical protein